MPRFLDLELFFSAANTNSAKLGVVAGWTVPESNFRAVYAFLLFNF
jgi:hypothetical protein